MDTHSEAGQILSRPKWLLGWWAAGTAITVMRLWIGFGSVDGLYAEDGAVFLEQALAVGPIEAIAVPYAGYIHLVPRLLAGPLLLLPAHLYGVGATITAALFTGFLAGFVATAGRDTVGNGGGAMAALALVLLPIQSQETIGNLANLNWLCIGAAAWAIIWTASERWMLIAKTAILSSAAVTTPLSFVLLPVAASRARRGDRGSHVVFYSLVAGLFVQLALILVGYQVSGIRALDGPVRPLGEAPLALIHDFLADLFGTLIMPSFIVGPTPRVIAGSFLFVATWFILREARSSQSPMLLWGTGVFLWVVVAWIGGNEYRYLVAPQFLMVSSLIVAVKGNQLKLPRTFAVLGAMACVTVLLSFPAADHLRLQAWSQSVEDASATCKLTAEESIRVPLSGPKYRDRIGDDEASWGFFVLSCRQLLNDVVRG